MINVVRAPRRTAGVNMLSNMNPHWNTGFVTSMCTNIAMSTAMTAGGDPPAGVSHRHRLDLLGRCRSRRRLGRHGRGRSADGGFTVGSSMAPSSTPQFGEDLLVGLPSSISDFTASAMRLGELGLVLGDDVAVGRGVVDVAEQFELAVGLLDR